ncbi:unnamed protein product, partial [Bubo scandiacus]
HLFAILIKHASVRAMQRDFTCELSVTLQTVVLYQKHFTFRGGVFYMSEEHADTAVVLLTESM